MQNLVIRDYAQRKGLPLSFSAVEYNMPKCYMMLNSLSHSKDFDGLIFYSIHQVLDGQCPYVDLLKPLLEAQLQLHFALEDTALTSVRELNALQQMECTKTLSHGTHCILTEMFN